MDMDHNNSDKIIIMTWIWTIIIVIK